MATKQQYLQAKWNITTGCTKTNPNDHHFGEFYSQHYSRYDALFKNNFLPTMHEQNLELPGSWKTPRVIEISPYSDLFDPSFTSNFIRKVFEVVENTKQHIYLLNTKHPERAKRASYILGWPSNLWLSTTIDKTEPLDHIQEIYETPALIRFCEFDPLCYDIPDLYNKYSLDFFVTTQTRNPDYSEDFKKLCEQQSIPLIIKTENREYPTVKSLDMYMFELDIDSTKSPSLWTIYWKFHETPIQDQST